MHTLQIQFSKFCIFDTNYTKLNINNNNSTATANSESNATNINIEISIELPKLQNEFKKLKRALKGQDDDLNYYYIWKILYTMFLQLKKKQSKVNYIGTEILQNIEGSQEVEFKKMEEKFNDEFEKLHWYDQKVFEIVLTF
mgnify:CR=1 FL=1